MPSPRPVVPVAFPLLVLLLSACASAPPPAAAPVELAQPQSAAASLPPPSVEDAPAAVPANLPRPTPTRPAKPAKPTPQTAARGKATPPPAEPSAPPAAADAGVATSAPPVAREASRPAPSTGPVWLAGCKTRVQSGNAIQCDADSLLVEPSATVRVYTREQTLARKLANGLEIQWREGLPRRYRFYVLP